MFGSDILYTIQVLSPFKALALKFQKLNLLPSIDSPLKLFPAYGFEVYFEMRKYQELTLCFLSFFS